MDNRNIADPDFKKAVQLHQFGILPDAVRLYQSVLTRKPDHPQALNMLGLAYAQLGNLPQAATLIERALTIQPNIAGAHGNLGSILQGLNRHEEALKHLEFALAAAPNDLETLNSIGAALSNLGRFAEAIPPLQQAVQVNPDYAEAHFNLGNAMAALGRSDEAIASYQRAIQIDPAIVTAHLNLGNVLLNHNRFAEARESYEKVLALSPGNMDALMNLATVLQKHKQFDAAIDILRKAIAAHPNNANTIYNLANTLFEKCQYDESVETYEAAIKLDPTLTEAHIGLGNALVALDRNEEAIQYLQTALKLQPGNIDAEINLGIALGRLLRTDEAVKHYQRALAIDPTHALAHKMLGLMYLEFGRFAEGWPHHEYRWQQESVRTAMRPYPQPRWRGEQVTGTLLTWGEHGLGDEILYASLVSDLRARCSSLVLEVEPRLVALFERSFPDVTVVARGEALYSGDIDVHSPAASLCQYLRPDRDSFPRNPAPFLRADETRAAELRNRLTSDGRLVVGLSWRSANPVASRAKTAQLRDFEHLMRLPGVRFIDLQYGDTAEEREIVERELGLRVEHFDDIDNTNDIDGLAALITACDAVVSVSNTTVHLTGALGRPVWVLVPYGHGRIWYWLREGEQTPWYPSVRIRRQARHQAWSDLFPEVARSVAAALKIPHGREAEG